MATTKKTAKKASGAKASGKGSAKSASADGATAKGEKGGKSAKPDAKESKRKLGLRGAAPWAARHAAKHAAEARARAAEPPLPGSARATIRVPEGADDIKQRIADLHNSLAQIKALRKNLAKGFFDIGIILHDVQVRRLYEAKGFGSFEAFLEREIDLGKTVSMRLVRMSSVFQREAALDYGMDRVMNALSALEFVADTSHSGASRPELVSFPKVAPAPLSSTALPLKPPGR